MFACVRLNMTIEQVYSIKHFLGISVDKTHQIRRESPLEKKICGTAIIQTTQI
jgi:hypothetical protein